MNVMVLKKYKNNLREILLENRLYDIYSEKKSDYEMKDYLDTDIDILKDLDKLSDIDKASDVIYKNLNKNILICSDLDCDGITSAITLYLFLVDVMKCKPDNVKVIVNRRRDGNGFNPVLVNRIKELHKDFKIDLMITSDHGSVNEKEYQDLKSVCGFDIVVTDHHTVDYNNYPSSADAFVNPQRKDSGYYKEISGCTVAFLVMVYTYKKYFKEYKISNFYNIFPYPAISIISDVMSCKLLLNRYIYKIGLNVINKLDTINFTTLRKIFSLPLIFNHSDIKMKLTSFVNSVNRMDIEQIGYDMLTSDNSKDCFELSTIINNKNNIKKEETKRLVNLIIDNIRNSPIELDGGYCFIVKTDISVNGILAAKIGEYIKLPTICFSGEDGVLSGSCRGMIPGFNILECLNKINNINKDILIKFGGHKEACGCSIHSDKYDEFKKLFYIVSKDMISNIDTSDTLLVDCGLPVEAINPDTINIIRSCGPYGKDWKEPLFVSKLKLKFIKKLNGFAIVSFVKDKNTSISGFFTLGLKDLETEFESGFMYYVYYNIDISSHNGLYDYSLNVINMKRCEE